MKAHLSASIRQVLRAAAISTAVVAATVGPVGAAIAPHATPTKVPTCSTVGPQMIAVTTGLKVAPGKTSKSGDSAVCSYATKTFTLAVVIQYNWAATAKSFANDRAGFINNGEKTSTISNLGSPAFSATLGSGSLQEHSVVALKGHTEILIGSAASIPDLTALVKLALPAL